jgi:hypothetical protein
LKGSKAGRDEAVVVEAAVDAEGLALKDEQPASISAMTAAINNTDALNRSET